jgi:hypothetical protein
LRLFADIAFIHWEGHRPFAPLTSGQQTHHAFPSLEDENIRRALLEQVVCLACEKDRKPDTYKIYRDIAKPIDFSWILNKLSEANSHSRTEDEMWASLLRNGLDFTSPNHVDAILTASQTSSILQAAFNFLLEPIDLDSEEADQQKKFQNLPAPQLLAEHNSSRRIRAMHLKCILGQIQTDRANLACHACLQW